LSSVDIGLQRKPFLQGVIARAEFAHGHAEEFPHFAGFAEATAKPER
jgi:hypothetical protein